MTRCTVSPTAPTCWASVGAVTTPFPFVAGAVLTATQLNSITELIINDKTASYTLVAGDAGERVIMNSASATTITVNNSLFTAGQIVEILNKGAGTCTVTAGAGVTVNGSGTALTQYKGGTLLALSASSFVFLPSGATLQTQVTEFTASGTFTPPTGVTYAVAHIIGGGGGTGNNTSAGTGGTSSVAFASGTISATGGSPKQYNTATISANSAVAGATYTGEGAQIVFYASGAYNTTGTAQNGQVRVAGATVTPGTGITVTVGAGGVAGSNGAAGGSGYVWIEYGVPT